VETWENGVVARNIIDGKGFAFSYFGNPEQLTSVMAPFYPYFLVTIYTLFGVSPTAHIIVQLIQASVQATTVVIIYMITKRLFVRKIGALSGLLFAGFPDYIFGVTVVHQLTFSTFVISILILNLLRMRTTPSVRRAVMVGLSIGACALIIPMSLVYTPFIGLWLLWEVSNDREPVPALKTVMLVIASAGFVVTPWTIRNYLVHDQFVLVKMAGYNFWRGNTPPAVYTGMPNSLSELPPAVRNRLEHMREVEADAFFMERAIEYVAAHPREFLTAILDKMFYFWWFPPANDEAQINMLRKIVYTPILLTGIAGIAVSRSNWRRFLPIYLEFVAFTVGYALFFIRPRYRTPTTQPYLIVFSAYFLYYSFERVTGHWR
jgi:hypothetical protein